MQVKETQTSSSSNAATGLYETGVSYEAWGWRERAVSWGIEKAVSSGRFQRIATRALQTAASIPYFQRYFNGFGYGSNYGLGSSRGPAMDREYLRWAAGLGDIGSSWIVQAYRKYLSLGLSAPRLMLVKEDLDNQQTEVTRHPALDRLKRPNDFCTWRQFIEAFSFNWIQGTHYVRKQRDRTQDGAPIVALWPEPKECVRPVVTPGPGGRLDEYLSGYEVYRDGTGTWYPVAVEDMIVWADGWDPKTREGRNWIRSVAAELYTDKGVSNHRARMVARGLPKQMVLGVGDKKNPPSPETLKILQQFAEEKLQEDTPVLLLSGNITSADRAQDLGADGLARLCKPSEEHFAAVAQVSVISLLFAAGADVSTYSNVETMTRRDFRQVIVPTLDYIAEVLTLFLLVEYATIEQANGKRLRFTFDYSEVPQMQRDKKIDQEWTTAMFLAGGIKHREWREQMGYPGGEDKFIWEIPGLRAKMTGAAGTGTTGDPALDAPPQSSVPSENKAVRRLLMADGLWHPVPRDTDRGQVPPVVSDETRARVM